MEIKFLKKLVAERDALAAELAKQNSYVQSWAQRAKIAETRVEELESQISDKTRSASDAEGKQ